MLKFCIYEIMKTMWPHDYQRNSFVATHVPGHSLSRARCLQMHEKPQNHCGNNRENILINLYFQLKINAQCTKLWRLEKLPFTSVLQKNFQRNSFAEHKQETASEANKSKSILREILPLLYTIFRIIIRSIA